MPEWGSPVRLALPVALDDIVLGPGGGLGAFGAHQGGQEARNRYLADDGLFAVDESGGRARLTMERQRDGYPSSITPNAAIYVERAPIYLGGDVEALGLAQSSGYGHTLAPPAAR